MIKPVRRVEIKQESDGLFLNIIVAKADVAAINWMIRLPLEIKERDPKIHWWEITTLDRSCLVYDANLHYHRPHHEVDTPTEGCPYVEGGKCYSTSVIGKDGILPVLLKDGLEGVFDLFELTLLTALPQGDLL